MKKEKGFTLIELLAVIVILAIIAIIAVPQVLKILAKSRLGAAEDSANGIIKSAETYVANFMLQNNGNIPNEQLVFNCNKDFPNDTRYYDLYKTNYGLGSDIWYDYETGKLGDATKEIAVTGNTSTERGLWFSDYAGFAAPASPWFLRGGYFSSGSGAGVLYFNRGSGRAYSDSSSRVVLAY